MKVLAAETERLAVMPQVREAIRLLMQQGQQQDAVAVEVDGQTYWLWRVYPNEKRWYGQYFKGVQS